MLFPRGYSISATREIDVPAEEIYAQLEHLPNWQSWSQWNPERVDNLTIEYGADGKSQRWSDIRGDGKLWITDQKKDESVQYQMRFANFPEMTSSIRLSGSEGTTVVSWNSDGVLPSRPLYGIFRHIYVSEMARQYEQSLDRLKAVVEKSEEKK